jgi:hypothetical protein
MRKKIAKKSLVGLAVVLILAVTLTWYYYTVFLPQEDEGLPEEVLGWSLELTVNGESIRIYNYSELSPRTNSLIVTVQDKEITIQVVPLTSLLEENDIDPDSIASFTAKALDGYLWDFNGSYVHDAYIQVVEEEFLSNDGPLRIVVVGEDVPHKAWVKLLVEIDFETYYD